MQIKVIDSEVEKEKKLREIKEELEKRKEERKKELNNMILMGIHEAEIIDMDIVDISGIGKLLKFLFKIRNAKKEFIVSDTCTCIYDKRGNKTSKYLNTLGIDLQKDIELEDIKEKVLGKKCMLEIIYIEQECCDCCNGKTKKHIFPKINDLFCKEENKNEDG